MVQWKELYDKEGAVFKIGKNDILLEVIRSYQNVNRVTPKELVLARTRTDKDSELITFVKSEIDIMELVDTAPQYRGLSCFDRGLILCNEDPNKMRDSKIKYDENEDKWKEISGINSVFFHNGFDCNCQTMRHFNLPGHERTYANELIIAKLYNFSRDCFVELSPEDMKSISKIGPKADNKGIIYVPNMILQDSNKI